MKPKALIPWLVLHSLNLYIYKVNTVIAYSDNVCPFCCIASRRLERLRQELPFVVEWRSFELHPEVPEAGISLTQHLGNKEEEVINHIVDYGKDVGLKLNTRSLYNSHNSLKLNEFALREGKFEAFHKAIFKAYLEDDINIGLLDELLTIAESAGLDKERARSFISSEEAEEIVVNSCRKAQRLGITSVPSFIINRHLIRGAYPYDILKKLFLQAFSQPA
ncbi:MAG TPA: DsbA family oxidoreductase [Flammeovirgaceae bacterium]|nr:DsbA family oxidoreductase [Flammeovirgaceae bacterium]